MSAGLTAGASLMRGVGEYEAGETRSNLFRANSDIARFQSTSEEEAAAYNEQGMRMREAATEGKQVAQIGASNLQQTGTEAQVVASTRMVNEMDILTQRNNALRRAWGFQVQGASDQEQAQFAQRAGVNEAFGSILSGGARAMSGQSPLWMM